MPEQGFKKRPRYHEQVFALALAGHRPAQVARELGIGDKTIRRWFKQYEPEVIAIREGGLRKALEILDRAIPKAAQVLLNIVEMQNGPDAEGNYIVDPEVQAKYAIEVLKLYMPLKNGLDLERRLAELERRLAEQDVTPEPADGDDVIGPRPLLEEGEVIP